MSAEARRERSAYNRLESEAAARAENWWGSLWDDHAFIVRYGTAAELDARGRALAEHLYGWVAGGGHHAPADVEAIDGLQVAVDRLRSLYASAGVIEERLEERGYVFDTSSRTLREIAGQRRGPKRTLASEWIIRCFRLLTEKQGYERENSKPIRAIIRSRLADKLHPDLLSEAKIKAAVNAALNPERHY